MPSQIHPVPSFSGTKYQLWIKHIVHLMMPIMVLKEPAPTKAPLQDGWMNE
jgi:hypothetical protein